MRKYGGPGCNCCRYRYAGIVENASGYDASQVLTNSVRTDSKTTSYTLVIGDSGKIIEMNVATANTVTIPTNASVAFTSGTTSIDIVQFGAGLTSITGAGGVTVNGVFKKPIDPRLLERMVNQTD